MTTYIITFCAVSQEIEAATAQDACNIFCKSLGYKSALEAEEYFGADTELLAERVHESQSFIVTLSAESHKIVADDEEQAKAVFIQEYALNLSSLPAADHELIAERIDPRNEWKPIETAPNNGANIILSIPGEAGPKIGYFDEGLGYWRTHFPAELRPTHWRPMFGMPDSEHPDTEWLPIETAPTDGTAVMLALPGAAEWRNGWFQNGVWRNQYVRKFEEAPTHWRPRLTMPEI